MSVPPLPSYLVRSAFAITDIEKSFRAIDGVSGLKKLPQLSKLAVLYNGEAQCLSTMDGRPGRALPPKTPHPSSVPTTASTLATSAGTATRGLLAGDQQFILLTLHVSFLRKRRELRTSASNHASKDAATFCTAQHDSPASDKALTQRETRAPLVPTGEKPQKEESAYATLPLLQQPPATPAVKNVDFDVPSPRSPAEVDGLREMMGKHLRFESIRQLSRRRRGITKRSQSDASTNYTSTSRAASSLTTCAVEDSLEDDGTEPQPAPASSRKVMARRRTKSSVV